MCSKNIRTRTGARTVNPAVAILVGFANHLVDFVVCKLLADRRHDVAQLGRRDKAIVVAIEHLRERIRACNSGARWGTHLERLPNLLLGVRVLHLPRHHREKLCEHVSKLLRL